MISKALNILSILSLFIIASSCSTDPEPINFGSDQCQHCKMIITDIKFGAEVVTKKGKAYKFDAAECMMNMLEAETININDAGGLYVIDASNPKQLTDAVNAVYLISEKFPSPMGANLSAFANRTDAERYRKDFGGEILSWDELKRIFDVL